MPTRSLLTAAILALLLGTQRRPTAAPGTGVIELRIDAARSHLVAVSHRMDMFSIARTDHTFAPTEWTVSLCLDLQRPTAPGFLAAVEIKTASLRVDAAEDRELAGIAGPADAAAGAELRQRLLGPQGLDAAHHPEIRWEASTITQAPAANPVAEGKITLRGITRPLSAVITEIKPAAGGDQGELRIAGSFTMLQSAFGLPPETADGDDEVRARFDLQATATGKPCPAASQHR